MIIAKMERLLVATRNKLLVWDKEPRSILEKQRYYVYHHFYGISWDTKNIYIGHRLAHKHGVIQIFDKEFNWKERLSFEVGFQAPHQILWWDGKLYMTDARQSHILIWDGEKASVIKDWCGPSRPFLHVNSIWCDGKKFYVLEHRSSKTPKRVQLFDLNFKPIEYIALSGKVLPKRARKHGGVHNVYVEDGFLYIFAPGALVQYHIASGNFRHIVPHKMLGKYYARGLARTCDRFFIGLSEVKSRGERDKGDSFILVTNNDFKVLDILHLKDTGALHEIRAIDSLDWAHNRIKCPLLGGKGINYDQKKLWTK